ncbi:unnamed protein product [Gongylonema pulchrum]|uniref:Alternative protein n=1 Tax=Gongylonema pulchrum TaxID=637853 RepID=A0A183DKS1_9BILA|nr:unnamed protein product [Gongylonema pulchrum]
MFSNVPNCSLMRKLRRSWLFQKKAMGRQPQLCLQLLQQQARALLLLLNSSRRRQTQQMMWRMFQWKRAKRSWEVFALF